MAKEIIARSRLTSQGRISVPAAIRQRLGLHPGATIEWQQRNGGILVRRVGTVTSEQIHAVLFPKGPPAPHTLAEIGGRTGCADAAR